MGGRPRGALRAAAAAAACCSFCCARPAAAVNVTLSGHSAGGSMAMQHLFAFSSSVRGAAVAGGSAYGCGAFTEGHLPEGRCYWGGTNVLATINYVHQRFRQGLIDDPANLRDTPVLLFNGKHDWTVYTKCMAETRQQLEAFVRHDKLASVFDTNAAHVWSLDHGGCACGACAMYGRGLCCDVNNCGYDFSGDMLTRFYGPLRPRAKARHALHWIGQQEYVPPRAPSWSSARMHEWALAYVPSGCLQRPEACAVHVSYHGCIADDWAQRRLWALNLDLNEYGEANDIIVLYPQARGDATTGSGCWNWGFPQDDQLFDTRLSVQLLTVRGLLADLPRALRRAVQLPPEQGPPARPAAAAWAWPRWETGEEAPGDVETPRLLEQAFV